MVNDDVQNSDDVCIRCRVRRAIDDKIPEFGEMIPMICLLRKWKSSNPNSIWSLLKSLSPSSPTHGKRSFITTERKKILQTEKHPFNDNDLPIQSMDSVRPELVFNPVPDSSPRTKSSSRSSSRHSSRMRTRTPRAHSNSQSLSSQKSDRNLATEQALRRHKRVKSEGRRGDNDWLEKINLRSSSPDPTHRKEESLNRRKRHALTPNGSMRANALFSVNDNDLLSDDENFPEEEGQPFTIALSNILMVDKSPIKQIDPSIIGSTLYITTRPQGYLELTFCSQHSQDVVFSFLCVSLPNECIRKRMKTDTFEENLIQRRLVDLRDDMDDFEAKAVNGLVRNETLAEKARRRATRFLSSFTEKLSECVCGPKSLDIHSSAEGNWLGNNDLSTSYPHKNMIHQQPSFHGGQSDLILINDDYTVGTKLSLEVSSLQQANLIE